MADAAGLPFLLSGTALTRVFYIVGPTAAGKSDVAAEVAHRCGGEVVNADAFQMYCGLDLLTAKPAPALLQLVPHHLIGAVALGEEMNAERFRSAAVSAIREINRRGKPALIVGGSGMYVKTLTHGISPLPAASPALRERLNQCSPRELCVRLSRLDGETARTIDPANKQRLVRAVEICVLSGRPVSAQRRRGNPPAEPAGILLFRDREELYERIHRRVEWMFVNGVVEEVRAAGDAGPTAAKTLGLQAIRDLIASRISEPECIASIQQATRHYAKRQLTWFRRQTNFEPLNLSLLGSSEAIEWITRKARLSFAQEHD